MDKILSRQRIELTNIWSHIMKSDTWLNILYIIRGKTNILGVNI